MHCHSDKRLCLQAVLRHVRSPWASRIMAAEEFLERQTMLLLQLPATPLHVQLLQHVLQQSVQSAGTLQGGLPAPCVHNHLTSLGAGWHSVAHALHSLHQCRLPSFGASCKVMHSLNALFLIPIAAWLPKKALSLTTAAPDLPTFGAS